MRIPRTSVLFLGPLLASLALAEPEPPLPERIEVFATSDAPVDTEVPGLDLPVTVYDLDAPERIEARWSEGLPKDPEQAMPIARARMAEVDREEVQGAYAGVMQALRYHLTRYPAIVFDGGQAVVYGVPDLGVALAHYQHWRNSEAGP